MLILMMTEGHPNVMKRWNCEPDMVVATLLDLAVRMRCRAHYCCRMRMWLEIPCCSEMRSIRQNAWRWDCRTSLLMIAMTCFPKKTTSLMRR